MNQRSIINSEKIRGMLINKIMAAPCDGTIQVSIQNVEGSKTWPQLKAIHAVFRDIAMQRYEAGYPLVDPDAYKQAFKEHLGERELIQDTKTGQYTKERLKSFADYTKKELNTFIDNTVNCANADMGLDIIIDPSIRALLMEQK